MTSTPILCTDSIAQWQSVLILSGGGPGLIPGRCSSIIGFWREVLGRNVYITSQYFFPAIIYRDIISHVTSAYRYIMYFFRTFKKSTAPCKVHNMSLRYIKTFTEPKNQFCQPVYPGEPVQQPYSYSVPSPHTLLKNSSTVQHVCVRLMMKL